MFLSLALTSSGFMGIVSACVGISMMTSSGRNRWPWLCLTMTRCRWAADCRCTCEQTSLILPSRVIWSASTDGAATLWLNPSPLHQLPRSSRLYNNGLMSWDGPMLFVQTEARSFGQILQNFARISELKMSLLPHIIPVPTAPRTGVYVESIWEAVWKEDSSQCLYWWVQQAGVRLPRQCLLPQGQVLIPKCFFYVSAFHAIFATRRFGLFVCYKEILFSCFML